MHSTPAPGAVLAVLALVIGHPGPAVAGRFQIGYPITIKIEDRDDGRLMLRVSEDGRTIKADARGHFELNDMETDFARVSPGGWFRIEERRRGRTEHRLELRGLPDGTVSRVYWRGGEERELDAEGRAWLADALQVVVLHTEFGLERHLETVLKQSGLDAALTEVESMGSDHSQREAYRIVLDRAGAAPDVAARVVKSASRAIDSDHELAELLAEVADRDVSGGTLQACAEAAVSIGSDHECGRVLRGLLDRGKLDPPVLSDILRSAGEIGSDHERAEVLLAVYDTHGLDATTAPAYFDALGGVGSDHEHGRTLRALARDEDLEPEVLRALLEDSETLGSDGEKADVLEEVIRTQKLDADLRASVLRATETIGSDRSRERVLEALHDQQM